MAGPRLLGPEVTVFQSRLFQMNSALIASGDGVALVDPGVLPDELDGIAAEVAGRPVTLVVQTHWHWDHVAGLGRWPDAPLLASGRYLEMLAGRGAEMREEVSREASAYADRGVPEPELRAPTLAISGEGPVGSLLPGWTAIPVPGHTPDMLAVFHEATGTCLCADLGSDIEPPTLDGSSGEFLRSVERLLELPIVTLMPGHGSVAEGQAVRQRLEFDRAYLAGLREAVARAVEEGATLDQVHGRTLHVPGALRYPSEHQWNVLQVWNELGGPPAG